MSETIRMGIGLLVIVAWLVVIYRVHMAERRRIKRLCENFRARR